MEKKDCGTCNLPCKGECLKTPAASAGYPSVGDVVVPIRGHRLFSGCGAYDYAIVISVDPFVLASAEGDMRWSATAKPEYFKAIGKADSAILKTAMRRLDG